MSSLFREGSLGAILFKAELITEKDIESALEEQKRSGLRFGEALVSLGIVKQEDIDWALSHQLDIPYARIRPESVDPAAVQLVPAAIARRFNLLPLIRTGDELRIAIADPLDREAIAEVERVSGCSASIAMGLLREIREMQDLFYGQATAPESLGFSSSRFSPAAVDEINSDATGMKLINCLIRCLYQTGLTSLSLKPLRGRVEIAARKNGVTQAIGSLDIRHYADVLATVRKTAGVSADCEISTAGIICPAHRGEGTQAQVELMRAGAWEYVTFKPLVGSPFPGRLADLDVPAATRETLRNLIASPAGLVIIAAADDESRVRLMDMLAQECAGKGRDIVLIGKGFAFSGGRFPVVPIDRGSCGMGGWITAALAHEPDVIAVETLSDAEALRSAIDAVRAGNLLLGGMRVDGMRVLLEHLCSLQKHHPALPAAIIGVAAIRRVPVLCRACKTEVEVAGQEIRLPQGLLPPIMFRPQGCPACGYTGYADKRILVEAVAYDDQEAKLFDAPPGGDKIGRFLKDRISYGIADEAAAMLRNGDITADMFMAMTRGKGDQSWPE